MLLKNSHTRAKLSSPEGQGLGASLFAPGPLTQRELHRAMRRPPSPSRAVRPGELAPPGNDEGGAGRGQRVPLAPGQGEVPGPAWSEGSFVTPAPPQGERVSALMRAMYRLGDELRPFQPLKSQRFCRRVVLPELAQIAVAAPVEGGVVLHGLTTCGSPWACPVCSARIRAGRAAEVQQTTEWWRKQGGAAVMLTLTFRHGLGDDLRVVRQGVANALRRFTRGKGWKLLKVAATVEHQVRALEVTHGWVSGWHPHLHILLLVRDSKALEAVRGRLEERWRSMVVRELGEQHAPDELHGAVLTPASDGTYLAKLGLGLELAEPGTKRAKNGNRTPWEIAVDATENGEVRDIELWQGYVLGMKGAKQLTWSKGLREAADVEDVTDEELAEGDGQEGERVLATIPAGTWRQIAFCRGVHLRILDAAVAGGQAALDRVVVKMLAEAEEWKRRRREEHPPDG